MNEELELRQYGDKELWYIKGQLPEGAWSLPLWVKRFRSEKLEYVMVSPIAVLPPQKEQFDILFSDRAIWKNHGSYIIDNECLEHNAHKAPGVTPDFYRKWPGVEAGVPTKQQLQVTSWETPSPSNEAETFLRFVAQRRGISYNLIKLVWWAIREEGPSWMIGEMKPIDLGFAMLYPIPFRANWKEIMLAKHPFVSTTFNKSLRDRDKELLENGFMGDLCSCHNLALDPDMHTISWHIETVPQKDWNELNNQIESVRLSNGKDNYINNYETTLRKVIPSILKAMDSYLSKIAIPFADIRYRSKSRGRYMVPFFGRGVRPKAIINSPCRVMVNPEPISLINECGQKSIHTEAAEMPKVSSVLQDPEDLRRSIEQSDMAEPKDGEDGTIRMPVPHADKS